MPFPVSHKTVFILDHSASFAGSSDQSVEFDIFTKTRQPCIIPLAPLAKSLWTCALEASIEYCRIVWDIYPTEKLMRFVVCDTSSITLNSWSQEQQNLNHLMSALAEVGPPSIHHDCIIEHGLNAAIQALCECSEVQHERRTSLTESAGKVVNRGRVICFTFCKNDQEVNSLLECFQDSLVQHNKVAASSDSLMSIQQCELVLMHVHPINEDSFINSQSKKSLSSILSTEVHSVKSGRHLAAKLGLLVQTHYNLASTTVTGIPMKEEQNASSSANYDVELLHPAAAHTEIFKSGILNTETSTHNGGPKEGQVGDTVTLKWCTPRSNSVELHYCTTAFRITPVDVNNRPSSCLTNFLLNGRAVMLEMPRKTGSKVTSHMLASHGGEIFIHTLSSGRSALEDPPSISEGCGGRVTDYRINDFGDFMKQNRLVPHENKSDNPADFPIEKAKKKLERLTQYWPMVIGHTTIFNMHAQIGPLLQLITKETLDLNEVNECKKAIYNLVSYENKGLPLPVPTVSTRGKGPKREEHYRITWNELEAFVRCHCLTAEHRSVLDCVLELRKPSGENEAPASLASVRAQLGATDSPPKRTTPKEEKDVIRIFEAEGTVDEKAKPFESDSDVAYKKGGTPAKKIKLNPAALKSGGTKSLLSIWTDRLKLESEKRFVDFVGRVGGNGPAKLYPNMKCEGSK